MLRQICVLVNLVGNARGRVGARATDRVSAKWVGISSAKAHDRHRVRQMVACCSLSTIAWQRCAA